MLWAATDRLALSFDIAPHILPCKVEVSGTACVQVSAEEDSLASILDVVPGLIFEFSSRLQQDRTQQHPTHPRARTHDNVCIYIIHIYTVESTHLLCELFHKCLRAKSDRERTNPYH